MPSPIEKLFDESSSQLCEGCPALDEVAKMTMPDSNDEEIRHRTLRLQAALRVAGTALLREEVGCKGAYLCGSCVDLHCGAERDTVAFVKAYAADEPADY